MKKIISTLVVALCLLMSVPAQAQFQFGLKGGLNLSKADFSGLSKNFKTENMAGFFVGPMAEFTIPVIGLGVDGALLYAQKGTKFTYEEKQVTNKQHSFDIPVNLKYSIGLGSMASIFVAAGPNFSFNIKGDNIGKDLVGLLPSTSDDNLDIKRKKMEIGLNLGVGVKLIKHLQIGINYQLPLSDSATKNIKDGDWTGAAGDMFTGGFKSKNKLWQVSVAYLF